MTVVRRLFAVLLGALLLVVALVVVIGWPSPRDYHVTVSPQAVRVSSGQAAVERGRYLAQAVAVCGVCHGDNLGGQTMSASLLYGYITTPNLTRGTGGIGNDYTVIDWVRAIRHGVGRDGRAFAFMPVDHYFHITDADLGDMIAYLRQLEPVDNPGAGRMDLGIIPRFIINSGLLGDLVRPRIMDHDAPRPPAAAGRGEYLVRVGGCDFCHGGNLRGGQGPEPGAPPAPDITASGRLAGWHFEQFAAVMLTGTVPEERIIDPMFMPWKGYRNLSLQDLRTLFDYLRTHRPPAAAAR